jgi:hypothetical protein
MGYESKFDVKRPQPGDSELATILRSAKAGYTPTAEETGYESSSDAVAELSKLVFCACGQACQSRAGWDAQGLCEELANGDVILHNLSPEHCCRMEETRKAAPLGRKRFVAYGRRITLNPEAHHEFEESWPPRVLIDFRSQMERHNGTPSQILDTCARCGHEHRVWLTRDSIWRLVGKAWCKKRLCVECFKVVSAKKVLIPDGPPQQSKEAA